MTTTEVEGRQDALRRRLERDVEGEVAFDDYSRHLFSRDASMYTMLPLGVVQDQLNQAAAPHGLLFGPDTSTSNRATIGGMTGNNSAGSGSVRYGMTIDHVRALDVVLSDGSTARLEPVDET